jgi:pimeloyl-ACP methyl ester carboxylesterase
LVDSDGVAIHYEAIGWDESRPAEAPLLLHTGAGGDLRMWHEAGYVDALSPRPMLLVDHRGHGRSGRPTAVDAHAIDRYVEDVVAVLDHAGAPKAVFIGYSDGAAIGFAFAAAHPERTAALVALGALGAEHECQADRHDQAKVVRAGGMDAVVDSLVDEEPAPVPAWFTDQMRSTDTEMFALELDGWAAWAGPWSTLRSITAPTLIIVGELEDITPGLAGTNAREMARRLQNGRAIELPATGHVGLFTRTDLTLPAMQTLLDTVEP